MLHRNPSIAIRTLQSINSNHSLENQDSWFFQYVECSKVCQQDRQKMTLLDGQNKIIIKTSRMPHGYVMLFTYAFLKLYFVEKHHFKKSLQTLFAILDDDQFKFFIPDDSSSPYYLDWSNSKIKRMTAEYFKDLQAGKYQNADQIIKLYPDFYKAFFLFSISILKYCEKCYDFEQFVDFDIVKEVLFDYFDIQAYAWENQITIPECHIKVQIPNSENIYILNMDQKKQSTVGINTSQSLQIQNQHNQNNQLYNLKLQLISSSDFKEQLQKSLKSRNLLQITNRAKHTKSRFSLRSDKKTQRLRHQSEPNELHQFEQKQNDDSNTYRQTQQSQNLIFRTENNKKNNPRNSQHSKKIQKLFELTNRKTSTQKSIYDDPKQVDSDQYSVLDESIPTSKKINQRKFSKQNIEMPTVSKTINFSNDSLINKWYEFCKIRKNKSAQLEINMECIEKSMNSTESSFKKSNAQSQQDKPKAQKHDFRKIKTRNRKSQDFNFQQQQMKLKQEVKVSPSQNSSKFSKQTKCQKLETPSDSLTMNSHKQCSKYFVPTNPKKKNIKPQNRYTKYGYVNMNISQQFTDSLILKQLDEKVHSHVKDMKEKARQERQSVKLMLNLENQV